MKKKSPFSFLFKFDDWLIFDFVVVEVIKIDKKSLQD